MKNHARHRRIQASERLGHERTIAPRYVTDEAGERVSVGECMALPEELEDLAALADRREEGGIAHEALVAGLMRDGVI